jgi:hypothetical protein
MIGLSCKMSVSTRRIPLVGHNILDVLQVSDIISNGAGSLSSTVSHLVLWRRILWLASQLDRLFEAHGGDGGDGIRR